MLKIGLKRWALVETARPRLFSHSNCAASRISTKCQAQALTWAELHYSSRLARWAGLCYYPAAELPALVEAEGLTLVAQGHTDYTSWFIAEGEVGPGPLLNSTSGYRATGAAATEQLRADDSWRPSPAEHTLSTAAAAAAARTAALNGAGQAEAEAPTGVRSSSGGGNSSSSSCGNRIRNSSTAGSMPLSTASGPLEPGSQAELHSPHQRHPNPHHPRPTPALPPLQQPGSQAPPQPASKAAQPPGPQQQPSKQTQSPGLPPSGSQATQAQGQAAQAVSQAASHSSAWVTQPSAVPAKQPAAPGPTAPPQVLWASGSGRQRFVFLRGVQWSDPGINSLRVSAALWNFMPAAFAPDLTRPPGAVVAHAGIAGLALDLYNQLLPHLQEGMEAEEGGGLSRAAGRVAMAAGAARQSAGAGAGSAAEPGPNAAAMAAGVGGGVVEGASMASPPPPLPLVFAGHSLGGALGLVLAARCCLNRHWRPRAIGVQTFGSPSVLAHRDGGGGDNVLQVLGLLSSAVRSFVLEHDPVPKAFITADPTYLMLQQVGPVRQLLEARSWLSGSRQWARSWLTGTNPDTHLTSPQPADTATGGWGVWAAPWAAQPLPAPAGAAASQHNQPAIPASQAPPGTTSSSSTMPSRSDANVLSSSSTTTTTTASTSSSSSSNRGSSNPPAGVLRRGGGGWGGWGWDMLRATAPNNPSLVSSQAGTAPHTPSLMSEAFSLQRFVYERVGGVYLLQGGAEVRDSGSPSGREALLQPALTELIAQPTRALQAWLDHHHSSYAHDLDIAALAALKREQRALRLQQQVQQQQQSRQQEQQQQSRQPALPTAAPAAAVKTAEGAARMRRGSWARG